MWEMAEYSFPICCHPSFIIQFKILVKIRSSVLVPRDPRGCTHVSDSENPAEKFCSKARTLGNITSMKMSSGKPSSSIYLYLFEVKQTPGAHHIFHWFFHLSTYPSNHLSTYPSLHPQLLRLSYTLLGTLWGKWTAKWKPTCQSNSTPEEFRDKPPLV